MNDVAAPVVELRLLSYRPKEMVAWWAALLGGRPQSLNSRMTAITGLSLRVVIERSQIALAYHPEASGVTAVNLILGDVPVVQRMLNRLARLGSVPERATRERGAIALWVRDPNGIDVALYLPSPPPPSPQKRTCCPKSCMSTPYSPTSAAEDQLVVTTT